MFVLIAVLRRSIPDDDEQDPDILLESDAEPIINANEEEESELMHASDDEDNSAAAGQDQTNGQDLPGPVAKSMSYLTENGVGVSASDHWLARSVIAINQCQFSSNIATIFRFLLVNRSTTSLTALSATMGSHL